MHTQHILLKNWMKQHQKQTKRHLNLILCSLQCWYK